MGLIIPMNMCLEEVENRRAVNDFSVPLPSLPVFRHLEQRNGHERDTRVRFDVGPHVYYIDGKQTMGSVTRFVHEYSQEFEPYVVLRRMRSGRNWPRPAYLRAEPHESACKELRRAGHDRLALMVEDGLSAEIVCEAARDVISCNEQTRSAIELLSLTDVEICSRWREQADVASRHGTWMHWTFEAFLNGVRVCDDGPEMDMFKKYIDTLPGLVAYRTEWIVFAEHEDLAGCIDFVAMNEAGECELFDWKRSNRLRERYDNPWQTMKPPFGHLPDCRGQEYRLQLNMYRWILCTYYNLKVAAMRVVCAHPDNGEHVFVDDVPVFLEMDDIMRERRARVMNCKAMVEEDSYAGASRATPTTWTT